MATKTKYPANGSYRVLRSISHPEATHADGCIRIERDGRDVIVTMKHRANEPEAIEKLVDELKALAYIGPEPKTKS